MESNFQAEIAECLETGGETMDPMDVDTKALMKTIASGDLNDNDLAHRSLDKLDLNELESVTKGIEKTVAIFEIFLEDKYKEGYEMFQQWSEQSLYRSLAEACMQTLATMMTMKKSEFESNLESAKRAVALAASLRKRRTIFSGINVNEYTDEECHAELVFAETSILYMFILVIADQTITGFIKAALNVRTAHNTYAECTRILNEKNNWTSPKLAREFEAGVCLGAGSFEVAIHVASYFIHKKFFKIIEMFGFSGNLNTGLKMLQQCADLQGTLRFPVGYLFLGAFHGFFEMFAGMGEGNLELITRLTNSWSEFAPNSVGAFLGNGFAAQLNGDFAESLKYYKLFVDKQNHFRSFHFMSFWQQMWIYASQWEWENATAMAKILHEKCSWSRALFTYIYAIFLSMLVDEFGRIELKEEVAQCLKSVPGRKRQLGGKKLFHEKLVIERSMKYWDNVDDLLFAPLEVMYIYSVLGWMVNNPLSLSIFLAKIEKKLLIHRKNVNIDKYCYLKFLKGVCFAYSKAPYEAIDCFTEVLQFTKKMESDSPLPAQACLEMGLIYHRLGDDVESKTWLKKSKKYSGYITEVVVKFKVDYALPKLAKE